MSITKPREVFSLPNVHYAYMNDKDLMMKPFRYYDEITLVLFVHK